MLLTFLTAKSSISVKGSFLFWYHIQRSFVTKLLFQLGFLHLVSQGCKKFHLGLCKGNLLLSMNYFTSFLIHFLFLPLFNVRCRLHISKNCGCGLLFLFFCVHLQYVCRYNCLIVWLSTCLIVSLSFHYGFAPLDTLFFFKQIAIPIWI